MPRCRDAGPHHHQQADNTIGRSLVFTDVCGGRPRTQSTPTDEPKPTPEAPGCHLGVRKCGKRVSTRVATLWVSPVAEFMPAELSMRGMLSGSTVTRYVFHQAFGIHFALTNLSSCGVTDLGLTLEPVPGVIEYAPIPFVLRRACDHPF